MTQLVCFVCELLLTDIAWNNKK